MAYRLLTCIYRFYVLLEGKTNECRMRELEDEPSVVAFSP